MYDLWGGRDFYRTAHGLTKGLGFCGLNCRSAPVVVFYDKQIVFEIY